ncbi:TetR/AcrR family transcriptional regulator [Pseudogracilibacillus auburnensis]|uniref:TetR/AcrR family transcriptional regulator n=1 Tax=Pseudogracilibacillus auburnensis TaxID=1494959 RepID=UPI001A96AD11|nr:TetR/AcrR family transcriptional regulator [Pseudogracilibacillus auburnensis]MBO1003208.1 TetR family transcriptional regulator [Pseudogracilibacillus auburnensis]
MATRGKITQATLKLFARKGFEATSIRDIALEAGLNSSTLYHYIKSKDDFLVSIMKNGLEELIGYASEIVKSLDTPEKRLAALVQMHIMIHGTHQLAMLVTDSEYKALNGKNKKKIRELRSEYEMIWRNVIEEGFSRKIFNKVSNVKLTTYALLSMCTGIVHWYSAEGDISLEQICIDYAQMSLNLLGTHMDEKEITLYKFNLTVTNSKESNL